MKMKSFKNTASVPIEGIEPNETKQLPVNDDGLLTTRELREFVRKGYLVEVKAANPEAKKEAK